MRSVAQFDFVVSDEEVDRYGRAPLEYDQIVPSEFEFGTEVSARI